jgi:hypothetical protein
MKKEDVKTWCLYYGEPKLPCIPIKFYGQWFAKEVQREFGCALDIAERAMKQQWESACQSFWEDVQKIAEEYFGNDVEVHSAGRCSEWVQVHGLPDLKDWDENQLNKWDEFTKTCIRIETFHTSLEAVLNDIKENKWVEEKI